MNQYLLCVANVMETIGCREVHYRSNEVIVQALRTFPHTVLGLISQIFNPKLIRTIEMITRSMRLFQK